MAQDAGLDQVCYRFFDANLGSAAGHNELMRDFSADLLLIINPDTAASPYLLNEMLLRMGDSAHGFGDIGIVEARQIPIEHPKVYDLESGETSWATTACALLPRLVVKEVGDFDADTFFLYCDDVDYSWRVRLAGRQDCLRPFGAPLPRQAHDARRAISADEKRGVLLRGSGRFDGLQIQPPGSRRPLSRHARQRQRRHPKSGRGVSPAARQAADCRSSWIQTIMSENFPRPGLFAEHRY